MKKYLLSFLLLLSSTVYATDITISGTTNIKDTGLKADAPTANYGGSDQVLCGWTNAGAFLGYPAIAINISSIPNDSVITSFKLQFYNNLDPVGNNFPTVYAFRIPSNYVVGTATGTYQNTSSSYNNRGRSSATNIDGTAATTDSTWKELDGSPVDVTTSPWREWGGDFKQVGNEPKVTISSADTFEVDLVIQAQDSHAAGKDWICVILVDTVYGGSGLHDRWRMITNERTLSGNEMRPRVLVTYQSPPPITTFITALVFPPSIGSKNTQLVSFTVDDPGKLDWSTFSVFKSDLTTRLYWFPYSIVGSTATLRVINTWAANPEKIYINSDSPAPSYMFEDSVYYDRSTFNDNTSTYKTIDDWDDWNLSSMDSAGIPLLSFAAPDWDRDIREGSEIIYDFTETDPSKRYKYFYVSDSAHADPARYANNFLGWASAPTASGPWTKHGVLIDSEGDSINIEDPTFQYLATSNQWIFVCEEHNYANSRDNFAVSLYYADSLDGVWTYYDEIVPRTSGGYPDGFLNGEPASPGWVIQHKVLSGTDTLNLFVEAFKGLVDNPDVGTLWGDSASYTTRLVSYGDDIGFEWHFTDSSGAVNDAMPMPAVVWWPATGQNDSSKSIPDFAVEDYDGDKWMFGHGYEGTIRYKGPDWRNLAYVAPDSGQWSEPAQYDSATGKWIQVWIDNDRDSLFLMELTITDTTLWGDPDWTITHRANKFGSHARFRGSKSEVKDGKLHLYPPPRFSGTAALMLKSRITGYFAVEFWGVFPGVGTGGETLAAIGLGADTLQDISGVSTPQAAWYYPTPTRGYYLNLNPSEIRFFGCSPGNSRASISGTSGTLSVTNFAVPAFWQIFYTSDDSLICFRDGVRLAQYKNTTHSAVTKSVILMQAEREGFNWGGVTKIDSLHVFKMGKESGRAFTEDILILPNSDKKFWKSLWRNIKNSTGTVWKDIRRN